MFILHKKEQQQESLHEKSNDTTGTNIIHRPVHLSLTDIQLDKILTDSILDFDTACKTLKHSHCKVCHSASIPIILLFGDDFQLPRIEEESFYSFDND